MQAHSPTKVEKSREDSGAPALSSQAPLPRPGVVFPGEPGGHGLRHRLSFLIRQGPSDLRFVQVNLANFGGPRVERPQGSVRKFSL